MEELLEMTLLQALHKLIKDEDLPLGSSAMWNLMLSARPFGSTLDVKRSKHKKLGAFFKAYGGKDGLLQLKEDKYSGDQVITGVNRGHELLREFRPYKASSMASRAEAAASPSPAGTAGTAGSDELVVEEVFRPGRELKGVLDALSIPLDHLFTAVEAGDAAFAYVQKEQLTCPSDPGSIQLDVTLCDALFKGIIKKGELFPSHLPKAELRAAFLRRCHPQCRISRGDNVVVKKGSLPTVSINTEKRQGNKKVTRIVGVESFLIDPSALASDCARRFAAACTTNELPGKTSPGEEIIIQGDVKEKVPPFLMDKYKIPKKYIEVKK
uniref:SUI1 domain-containing protein n=1 Tax=Dunaliella tertiolecta TaxID=3047 RepID=A0A7S3QT49_DUNTE